MPKFSLNSKTLQKFYTSNMINTNNPNAMLVDCPPYPQGELVDYIKSSLPYTITQFYNGFDCSVYTKPDLSQLTNAVFDYTNSFTYNYDIIQPDVNYPLLNHLLAMIKPTEEKIEDDYPLPEQRLSQVDAYTGLSTKINKAERIPANHPNFRLLDPSRIHSQKEIDLWLKDKYYKDFDPEWYNMDGKARYEPFNIGTMNWLLENRYSLWKYGIRASDVNQLLRYARLSRDGWALVIYKLSEYNVSDAGRRSVYCCMGLQSFCRIIRHTLAFGISSETDIVNCHPNMMADMCESEGLECEAIIKYRDHRNIQLAALMKANNCTRDEAKTAFIATMNCGGKGAVQHPTKFLLKLRAECIMIRDTVCANHPERLKKTIIQNDIKYQNKLNAWKAGGQRWAKPYKKNPYTSLMAFIMQETEDQILQLIEEFYVDKGILEQDFTTLIFDGLYIPIENKLLARPLRQELIDMITDKTGITLKLDDKDTMKDRIIHPDLEQFYKKPIVGNKPVSTAQWDNFCSMFQNMTANYQPLADDCTITDSTIKQIHLAQTRLPSFKDWMKDNDTLIVKSMMGSCKTVETENLLKTMFFGQSCLIILFRKTLNRKYLVDLEPLGFELYDNIREPVFDSEKHPRLIVQINSLYKVQGMFNTIILDEFSYTVDTLIDFSEKKKANMDALISYVKHVPKCIVLDAYVTKANIEFVHKMRTLSDKPKTLLVTNKITEERGTVENLQFDAFFNKIHELLDDGKRIVLASTSKGFLLDRLEVWCVKHKFKSLMITRDSEDLVNLDSWGDYQIVGYSPTIVAGLSYEVPDTFDYRFGYFCNMSASADIACQMLFRVRQTNENKIYIHVNNHSHAALPVTKPGLEEWLTEYANLNKQKEFEWISRRRNELNYCNATRTYEHTPFYHLMIDCMRKKFLSRNNFGDRLIWYLSIQGYNFEMSYPDIDKIDIISSRKKQLTQLVKVNKDEKMIVEGKEYIEKAQQPGYKLTIPEYLDLCAIKRKKTHEERIMSTIFLIRATYCAEVEEMNPALIKKCITNLPNNKFIRSFNLDAVAKCPMKFARQYVTHSDYTYQENWHSQAGRDTHLKALRALEYVQLMGFTSPSIIKRTFTYDTMKKCETFIQNHFVEFKHLFGMKKDKTHYMFTTKPQETRLQSFSAISGSILKKVGKRLNKKRFQRKAGNFIEYSIVDIVQIPEAIQKKFPEMFVVDPDYKSHGLDADDYTGESFEFFRNNAI